MPVARPAPYLRKQYDRRRAFLGGPESSVGPLFDSAIRGLHAPGRRHPARGGRCSGKRDWQREDGDGRKKAARVGKNWANFPAPPGLVESSRWAGWMVG